MCGRSSLTKTEKELEKRFRATFYSDELERYNPLPNYNVAPTQMLPVITEGDANRIHIFRWGLVPFWAKDLSIGTKMINARSETLLEKPAFKSLIASKRCIIPLDGFYEWKKDDKGNKIPFRIVVTDQEIFGAAGLWDVWVDKVSGQEWHTFTIITTPPNHLMEAIHDRMPAILLRDNESLWLDEAVRPSEAVELLSPYPSENMRAYQVSALVNNVRNRAKEVMEPVLGQKPGVQGTLF
jgi:putative SOS response-associated peptidase YedK